MPGPQELVVIAIVALLVFGPDRLPELARNAARVLARVRNEAANNVRELRRSTEIAELERDLRGIRDEFSGTRDDLRRTGRDLLRPDDDAATPRAEDAPPPTDPEAT